MKKLPGICRARHLCRLPFLCYAAVLAACLMPPDENLGKNTERFWAVDFTKQAGDPRYFYKISAQQLWTGEKCIIYAQNGSGVSKEKAREFADDYDNNIYGLMAEHFCEKDFDVENNGDITHYENTLEYANSLTGSDKLIILLMDIRDGYKPGGGYVAGYFSPNNFYSNSTSNYKTMIYVDTYPGMKKEDQMFETFAHELQHLVNYVTSMRKRGRLQMDTWINEGLSMMAEYLYRNEPLENRIKWYIDDENKTIAQGNNFYIWDNYEDTPNSVLDDYATAYMFFHWLYLQADNDDGLLRNIAFSDRVDYRAVTENAGLIIPGGGDWETLLKSWLAANYINDPESQYGYRGESAFSDIKAHAIETDDNTAPLFPGEGVYSNIDSSWTLPANGSGANIRYAGLQKAPPGILQTQTDGMSFKGDILLTYNKNTSGETLENGFLTGEPAPAASITRFTADTPCLLRLDAQDIMRRNNRMLQNMPLKNKIINIKK